ncbi:HIT domain-containing protein [Candidatus Saccharibacteria bacterium]|nr:MAG: HIT domain-containing protein [Candidatus Saccharibacteria bacterium]
MAHIADCPFCDARDRVLRENEHAFVLLSNPRKVPGHALVIPKRHVEEPWQLTAEERRDIFELLDYISQKILAAKLGEGVDVRQNYRPFLQKGKLSVRHIHYHAVPRTQDDYIYQVSEKYDTELFADLDPLEAKEVGKLLK